MIESVRLVWTEHITDGHGFQSVCIWTDLNGIGDGSPPAKIFLDNAQTVIYQRDQTVVGGKRYLVPIHGFIKGTDEFPIQKCSIFCKFKEIKELCGGRLLCAAQAIPPIDIEITGKGHLWTETI
ncbi:MAG: hypothetical protein WBN03_01005 [Desulfobacterales bacterium]